MGERPPRWLKCPRTSALIADKFVAFKTFLDEKFDNQVPAEDSFKFPMLKSFVRENKKQLGFIIDLTNTSRFYDKRIVEESGVTYFKLNCKGHGEAPSPEQTQLFVKICRNYLEKNDDKVIGVHCTHGFNRTGFLISAFLYQELDWSIEDAVQIFAKSRPPGIYKNDYIAELFTRYGSGSEDVPPAPELPEWCYEERDAGSDDEGNTNNSIQVEKRGKKRRRAYNENAKFAQEIDGINVVGSRGAERVQEICEEMLNWDRGTFPGSQPVSLDRQNIELLRHHRYNVTWKADGVRYLMLILKENEVYFIDRDNSVFETDRFCFPRRKNPDEHLEYTLVDGELVNDKEGDTTYPRFLIFDIIKFEGQDVGQTHLDRRLLCIDKEIIKPRNTGIQAGKINKDNEPFSVRKKDFYPLENASWVLEKLIPNIPHETDGLILQPVVEGYIPGQCPGILKWKPHDLNSVDFLLSIQTIKNVGCLPEKVGYLYVQGYEKPFSNINITQELKHYDKRIIECTWNGKQWQFLRVREDKSFPNAIKTAISVCKSIQHPVTKEYLIDFISNNGFQRHGSVQSQ